MTQSTRAPGPDVHAASADSEGRALTERVGSTWWFHSIDLGGITTPGTPPNEVLERPGAFPAVRGKTVLDIGAWDGKYSFRAEQEGARSVTSLDHYAWTCDWAKRSEYWRECESKGVAPDPVMTDEGFLSADGLPGRAGYELAHEVLHSSATPVVGDFMTMDLEELGVFDVVLYFGVLYHMREPLSALIRLRRVTREVAAIETDAIRVPGHAGASLVAFYAGGELNADHGSWYAPTEVGLQGMCRAAGFRRVETRVGPPPPLRNLRGRWRNRILGTCERYRIVVHAYP